MSDTLHLRSSDPELWELIAPGVANGRAIIELLDKRWVVQSATLFSEECEFEAELREVKGMEPVLPKGKAVDKQKEEVEVPLVKGGSIVGQIRQIRYVGQDPGDAFHLKGICVPYVMYKGRLALDVECLTAEQLLAWRQHAPVDLTAPWDALKTRLKDYYRVILEGEDHGS